MKWRVGSSTSFYIAEFFYFYATKIIVRELITYLVLMAHVAVWAQPAPSGAGFVANEGQWPERVQFRTQLVHGALFIENNGYSVAMLNPPHAPAHKTRENEKTLPQATAFRMRFVGGQAKSSQGREPYSFYHNYFLGKPAQWRARVPVYQKVEQIDLYPGVAIRYQLKGQGLKYDLYLNPGTDPEKIRWYYEGLDSFAWQKDTLRLHHGLGTCKVYIPAAYQMINGQKVPVEIHYRRQDSLMGFRVGAYNPRFPLVIDPMLDFSSYSGSGDLNYASSATYGDNGTMYGTGVNFGAHYPTTTGSFQPGFAGDSIFNVDVSISKFSRDGGTLLYATYLGGTDVELVQSTIADENGSLYLLGTTGSADFPVHSQAVQKSFQGGPYQAAPTYNHFQHGTDLFVARISTDGDQLMASTYLGGIDNEGWNYLAFNYGDHQRGEVVLTENHKVLITSSTHSLSFPSKNNTLIARGDSSQEAIVALLGPQLDQIQWSSFVGGQGDDAGFSVKAAPTQKVYVTGATQSSDLPHTNNTHQENYGGKTDGYLAQLDIQSGQIQKCSYYGSNERDLSFLLSLDRFGAPYITGQTAGSWTVSPGVYHQTGANQFITKFKPNLSGIEWQTTLGSGQNKQDWVPSAFYVDQCLNIYLSGWNGKANMVGFPSQQNGNTRNLPVVAEAYQSTTDGSDFYFMVLYRNAQSLLYSSYFGGADNEHVDGGTSRFDKDGVLYQAICANCNNRGPQASPQAYAPQSGNAGCNMMVSKFAFQQNLRAQARIGYTSRNDTICQGLVVNFSNQSRNATHYQWSFGNGDSSTRQAPQITYDQLGTYHVSLIAYDSICGVSDTSTLVIIHDSILTPKAEARAHYVACDQHYKVHFENYSVLADTYFWNFGDGSTSTEAEPEHQFISPGPHQVRLIAKDEQCQRQDTLLISVHFRDTVPTPGAQVSLKSCSNGQVNIRLQAPRVRYLYHWRYQNQEWQERTPDIQFEYPGQKELQLTITDPLCHTSYQQNISLFLEEIRNETFIPNAFSPNGDGLNERWVIQGDACDQMAQLQIFNKWGQRVFQTEKPFQHFWDGRLRGQLAPAGVYSYLLQTSYKKHLGSLMLLR